MPHDDLGPVDERELFGSPDDFARPVCEAGTCGWDGDPDICDLETRSNSGVSYVKVTLFAGHPRGESQSTTGLANGRQVLCRMMWPFLYVPPRGQQCLVLFPGGSMEGPGHGVCIPIGGPDPPSRLLPNVKEGDFVVYGGRNQFLRLHADGSVSLARTHDGTEGGRLVSLRLGPDGLEVQTPWGRLTCGKRGLSAVHKSGARLDLGTIGGLSGPLSQLASRAKLQAAIVSVLGSAVSLGTDGGAASQTALASLFTWLATHTHPETGATTGPPAVPPPDLSNVGKVA